jgi:hypothetical protein
MKRIIPLLLVVNCMAITAPAIVLVNWEFNDPANTSLTGSTQNGTLSGTWQQAVTGVAQDGSGSLVTTGNTPVPVAATNKEGLGITANSGIYDMIFSDVRFDNLSGNDYLVFGFRTTQTGSEISSSRERANFKVGNFNGSAGLDMQASVGVTTPLHSMTDVAVDFSNAFSFVLRIDTDNNLASAWYNIGSGLTQLGTNFTIDTATTINTIALRFNVSDAGAGDSISIGNISVVTVPVPEPSTYAALLGLLALCLVAVRRRRV